MDWRCSAASTLVLAFAGACLPACAASRSVPIQVNAQVVAGCDVRAPFTPTPPRLFAASHIDVQCTGTVAYAIRILRDDADPRANASHPLIALVLF